jgi:hypothetical protein
VISLDQSRPLHMRQLAAVLLKQHVAREPNVMAESEAAEIRSKILDGLSDPSRKMRTAVVSGVTGRERECGLRDPRP